jgi:endoglucanase
MVLQRRRTLLKSALLPVLLELSSWVMPSVALGQTRSATCVTSKSSQWSQWEQFVQHHVQADGRVIDFAVANQQSTSEGQSYGMFFALVANDRERFARIWRWTCDNLGASSASLPAWQWGKRDNGSYGVLDPNSASDSDCWIAYALLEAGRLWQLPAYHDAGMALLSQIKQKEVLDCPGLGPMLLPGAVGFAMGNQTWRFNPSYLPLPLLRKLEQVDNAGPWSRMIQSALQMLRQTAPLGVVPDWVMFQAGHGFVLDAQTKGVGSYDAIRAYLWAGMTAATDPLASPWRDSLSGMLGYLERTNIVPEKVDTVTGATTGDAPPGFSAALLPYLASLKQEAMLAVQLQRVQQVWRSDGDQGYYNSVLMLFGWGWQEGRYRFDVSGSLQPAWLPCQ